MEKGSKNHKETLYSSKGKIMYVVRNPCNIYRLQRNPIVIIESQPVDGSKLMILFVEKTFYHQVIGLSDKKTEWAYEIACTCA